MAVSPQQQTISHGQKVGFAFLFAFALLALGLGFLQMRSTIYGPFVNPNRSQASAADQAQILFDETIRLQRIDTDQDGLNDFEELNFYQTSPYLPDSDSDGTSDKKELDEGTDPLCPAGKDCGLGLGAAFDVSAEDTVSLDNPVFDQAFQNTGAILGEQTASGTPSLFNLGLMLQDPAQLRAALLASGQVTAETLASLNDDELLDLAQQAVRSQQGNTSTAGSSQAPQTQDVTTAELEALLEKPAELRQLLISTGKMTAAQLDQIDDTTLITVTKQIIAENR